MLSIQPAINNSQAAQETAQRKTRESQQKDQGQETAQGKIRKNIYYVYSYCADVLVG